MRIKLILGIINGVPALGLVFFPGCSGGNRLLAVRGSEGKSCF